MQDWLKDNFSTAWVETQKRFMQGLYTLASPPQTPVGISWWQEAYLQQLAQWETTVKQTLQTEANLIERWAGQSSRESQDTPQALSFWTGHMQGLLQQWMSIQHQLWDEFFSLLRGGAIALQEPTVDNDLKQSGAPDAVAADPNASVMPSAPAATSRKTAATADDLQLITGIGPATAQKLQAAGIVSYRRPRGAER